MSALKLVTPPNPGRLSLKAIKVVPELFQTRVTPDPETGHPDPVHVLKYYKLRQAGSEFPALVVYLIDGIHYLVSGHTRFAAARKLWEDARRAKDARAAEELATVPVVVKEGTMTDALLEAIRANLAEAEARPFRDADRMHAVEMMIRNGAGVPGAGEASGSGSWDWSAKEIATRCEISRNTVDKIRTRLKATEGIPFPDRVMGFDKDGKSTGKWQPARLRKGGRPAISQSKRSVRVYRNGTGKIFRDDAQAETYITAVERTEAIVRGYLSHAGNFRKWLSHRGIYAKNLGIGISFGGSVVGDAAVVPMAESTAEAAIAAVGAASLTRLVAGVTRMIVVGYHRADVQCSRVANAAAGLGVEFIELDEFLAEFGPAGGAPDIPADTAADAEGGDDDA